MDLRLALVDQLSQTPSFWILSTVELLPQRQGSGLSRSTESKYESHLALPLSRRACLLRGVIKQTEL